MPITEELMKLAMNMGVVGLLFVMWWFETRGRRHREEQLDAAYQALERRTQQVEFVTRALINNTQALTKLTLLLESTVGKKPSVKESGG